MTLMTLMTSQRYHMMITVPTVQYSTIQYDPLAIQERREGKGRDGAGQGSVGGCSVLLWCMSISGYVALITLCTLLCSTLQITGYRLEITG
jgi:hypothetical protein